MAIIHGESQSRRSAFIQRAGAVAERAAMEGLNRVRVESRAQTFNALLRGDIKPGC
ncbi:MAG: hypothetical protein ACJAWY_002752 [Sphingomonas echinoides]|jgi:hypothetical protein